MTTIHSLGQRAAQEVATGLVTLGLRSIWTDPYVKAGDEFYAKDVRTHKHGDSIDGLVSFTVHDDTTGAVCDVTVMVSATPRIGAA